LTLKETEALLASVWADGAPVTLKGVDVNGATKPVILIGPAVVFVMVTGIETMGPPMVWALKSASSGEATTVDAPRPTPLRFTAVVLAIVPAVIVLAVKVPVLVAKALGVNVTGTVMDWPVESDAGVAGVDEPMA
jgi:hypothetical protein